jgi:hypothetical protein
MMIKKKKLMEILKAYPLLFIFTVALPFFGGIIGAYVGWDSLKGRYDDNKNKVIISAKIENQDSTLNKIVSKDSIIELGNRAIANGDKESYLKLTRIVENFGKERDLATVEIARIKSHHYSMTTISGIRLEIFNDKNELVPETNLKTEQLIDILLLNTQYLFRARSAQLLSNRNERFVHEALLLSIFSDNNLEVTRESTKALEILTKHNSFDFFSPYGCLSYWYDNSISIISSVQKTNDISIIPFQEFEDKTNRNIATLESAEMIYWWKTSLDLEQMLKKNQKIESENKR